MIGLKKKNIWRAKMKKQKCNCWIGIYIYQYGEGANFYINNYAKELNLDKKCDVVYAGEYPDLFNYCPLCGKKINWKELKERLKNEI